MRAGVATFLLLMAAVLPAVEPAAAGEEVKTQQPPTTLVLTPSPVDLSPADLRQWLASEPAYLPERYRRTARALRRAGRSALARDVLYWGRERERTEVLTGIDFVWATVLHATVGYGYRLERVFLWAAFFVSLGAVVLRVSNEGRRLHMPYGLSFSLDMLLPGIHLRERHYTPEFDLHCHWARRYFYFHRLAGAALALLLAAAVVMLANS